MLSYFSPTWRHSRWVGIEKRSQRELMLLTRQVFLLKVVKNKLPNVWLMLESCRGDKYGNVKNS